MTPQQVFQYYGSQKATADALGITKGAMTYWKRIGAVPPLRQTQIQIKTKGKLKAAPEAVSPEAA